MQTVILLIIFFVLLFGYLYYVNHRRKTTGDSNSNTKEETTSNQKDDSQKDDGPKDDGECCGQHAVCERDLLISSKIQADYYDDEELDQFAGREPESYDEEERKMFEEVFYTLKEYDVSGWLRSLQLRGINPPENIKEEALFIVQERRFKSNK